MNIKILSVKLLFAILLSFIYLTLSVFSSNIINKILILYKKNISNKDDTKNLICRVYFRTALIVIFLYLIRSGIKFVLPNNIYNLDVNHIKQVERNAVICSYILFLLQPDYGKDIKKLFNKYL